MNDPKDKHKKHGPHVNKYAEKAGKNADKKAHPQQGLPVLDALSQQKKGSFEPHQGKETSKKNEFDRREDQKHKGDMKRRPNK